MKKITIIASLVLSALFAAACSSAWEEPYYTSRHFLFTFHNNSASDIYWFVPEHGDVECDKATGELPDTLTSYLKDHFYPVEAHSARNLYIIDGGVLSPIEQYHPADTVSFYIFDAKTYKETEWKKIVDEQLWLAHYRLSADDVVGMYQTITYPAEKN